MCSFRKYASDTCYVPDFVTAAGEVTSGNYILMEGGGKTEQIETKYLSWLLVSNYEEKRQIIGCHFM